ncbi:MAG: polysaccharide export protein [Candidatus Aureabacteria bacterium]|nr:polysaccharide export protein [Candidatus Auribacterota bacterium]
MKKKILLITIILLFNLLPWTIDYGPSTMDYLFAQISEYKLQSGDLLKITVHNQPDLTTRTRVSSDGFITFPLLGKIFLTGLTAQELEIRLKGLLEEDYLVNPQVLVFIEEYHPREISVLGEVMKPGKYNMPKEKDLTLLEAIAMAGGFSKDADRDKSQVMRTENGKKETIQIKVTDITKKGLKDKDILLKVGDIIFIPESFF